MADKKVIAKFGVGCSLPTIFMLTILLLVLQYTVAPQLPWWLVWGPAILFGGFGFSLISIFLLCGLVLLVGAIIVGIMEKMGR